MRKVILQEWLTIDGFAADRSGNLDFVTSPEFNKDSDGDLFQFIVCVLIDATYGCEKF